MALANSSDLAQQNDTKTKQTEVVRESFEQRLVSVYFSCHSFSEIHSFDLLNVWTRGPFTFSEDLSHNTLFYYEYFLWEILKGKGPRTSPCSLHFMSFKACHVVLTNLDFLKKKKVYSYNDSLFQISHLILETESIVAGLTTS